MTDPRHSLPEQSTDPASRGRGRAVPALAGATAVAASLALGFAAWIWYETYSYEPRPHEDVSLLGVGYVVAVVVAVPAGIALVLAALGWWLARRGTVGWGVGLTAAALALMVPFALFALRFVG